MHMPMHRPMHMPMHRPMPMHMPRPFGRFRPAMRITAWNSGLWYARATHASLRLMTILAYRMEHEDTWDQAADAPTCHVLTTYAPTAHVLTTYAPTAHSLAGLLYGTGLLATGRTAPVRTCGLAYVLT